MEFLRKSLLFLSFLSIFASFAGAQTNVLPDSSDVLDTIPYGEQHIVLYKANVWDYVIDPEILARDKAISDTMDIFTERWNNEITFPYQWPDPGPPPDSILIQLVDDERGFVLPHYGMITSGFGWRYGRNHKAIDIDLEKGTPVRAAFDGKVRYSQYNNGGYGNLIIIRHFNGLETYYAHLTTRYVKPNQIVKAGQIIGTGGNTGAHWTGAHLHFECRWWDHAFDPLRIIEFDSLRLKSDSVILTPADFKISQSHKAYVNNGVNGQNSGTAVNYGGNNVTNNKPVETNASASGKVMGNYYYVKKGDTLSAIARRFGTSVAKLCELNGISKNSTLHIGQKIRIK
ncbi:MAG: metalloendopeptidase [Marinilabiliales bacterium]|nr:MAG: metalloendopeptidase [Marinilabiliales bacterium]